MSDVREQVLADVTSRQPVDELERADIERFLTEMARLADPFDRYADPTHVTGSGFVVRPGGIVLLHHLRFSLWVQPGGHIDVGETPWEAAHREVDEETGMDVPFLDGVAELAHVSVHDVPDGHVHLDLRYLFDGSGVEPDPPQGESQDVFWFAWPEAITTAEPSLGGILRHLQTRFR